MQPDIRSPSPPVAVSGSLASAKPPRAVQLCPLPSFLPSLRGSRLGSSFRFSFFLWFPVAKGLRPGAVSEGPCMKTPEQV